VQGPLLESRSGVVEWPEEERRVRWCLGEDWYRLVRLTQITGGLALRVAVVAAREAEDENENARLDVVTAVREVLAGGRLLGQAVAGETADATRFRVPAGVPPLRAACLAAQPNTR
jgi:hypothetical protein